MTPRARKLRPPVARLLSGSRCRCGCQRGSGGPLCRGRGAGRRPRTRTARPLAVDVHSLPALRFSPARAAGNRRSHHGSTAGRQERRLARRIESSISQTFDGCALKASATQMVFADGNPKAKLMLVGEAPGRDEDIEGVPFVGRSGKLLNRMLAAIGFDRSNGLHRQYRAMAAARQPHADAAGNANLPALRAASNRTG